MADGIGSGLALLGVGGLIGAVITWWRLGRRPGESDEGALKRGTVSITPDQFAQLRHEPLLVDLLVLGRMANSLRFAQTAPLEVHDEGTPRAQRQLNGAFFVQVSFALEALNTLKKLSPNLKDRPSWTDKIVPLFRDRSVRRLATETVRDLRGRVVFHFDRDAIAEGLGNLRDGPQTLVAMAGTRRADTYFPLADAAAVALLVPSIGIDEEQHRDELRAWLSEATDLSLRISAAIESVIVDLSQELGLVGSWE